MARLAIVAVLGAVLLAGCSYNKSIDSEELKSDAAELTSIAAEGELFANFVAEGRASEAYVKSHPQYLSKQLRDLRKELETNNTEPNLQKELATLQKLSHKLAESLAALPATSQDPRWRELANNFAQIARAAQSVRRTS